MVNQLPRPPFVRRPKTVRTAKQRAAVNGALVTQVDQLQRRFAANIEKDVLRRLVDNRNTRDDLASIRILHEQDHPVLATDGDVLMLAADLETLTAQEQRVLAASPIRGIGVARVSGNNPTTRSKVTFRPNYVTAMGVVVKALCGPEPAGDVPPERIPPGRGTPLKVAVIDTGISSSARDDHWLEHLETDENADLLYPDPDPEKRNEENVLGIGAGHGTFVTGIIQQLAPSADLRVFNPLKLDGLGTEADVAESMIDALEWGADIINLSLGLETDGDEEPLALADAVRTINRDSPDVLIVAAAGNTGRNRKCWPGAFDGVTAVAGLTVDMKPAPWSTHGPWVTCSTIGEGIMSTYVTGEEDEIVDSPPDRFGANPWALWSGTSFAAPQIVGAVAQVAQRQRVGPHEALGRLLRRRRQAPDYGKMLRLLRPADIDTPVRFGPIG